MLIDDYVSELDRALRGPPGPKRGLGGEARDRLLDTAEALESEGLAREEAERQAVKECGDIAEITPGYQMELTAASGRRLGTLLFVSVPITVAMWSVLWRISPGDAATWASAPAWSGVVSDLI